MTVSHLFPGISYADCSAEITRELGQRRRVYPDRVAKLRMTEADAQYQLAIFAAIGADIARMQMPAPGAAAHGFSWGERRKALERELDYRTRFYPEWISKLRLTQAKADHQMDCLKAILWRYDMGFDWHPSNGTPCSWGTVTLDSDIEASRAEWRTHQAAITPRWYQSEPAQAAMI